MYKPAIKPKYGLSYLSPPADHPTVNLPTGRTRQHPPTDNQSKFFGFLFLAQRGRSAQLLGSKIQSLYGEVMRELEYGQLKDLDRDETKQALYNAANDLRTVQASNAISTVVLKKLKMLDPVANLLEEIGDAVVAFGE